MFRHLARQLDFHELITGLEHELAAGNVSRKLDTETGLTLWTYTLQCVYERRWNEYSLIARGLILDESSLQVVATPLPKFFNVGEFAESIPAMAFETFEKVDGSLIIIYHYAGSWRTATKGAFNSAQAHWAAARLRADNLSALTPGTTYLVEAVYPENRIVVRYENPALFLLAAYCEDGSEYTYDDMQDVCARIGWPLARRYQFESVSDLLVQARGLPCTQEGYVLRFSDGSRLKVKGDEYCRIHALISNCTPLSIWASMMEGDDLDAIRRQLPEEFWADLDAICQIIDRQRQQAMRRIADIHSQTCHLTDKELGLSLSSIPAEARPFIFQYRKNKGAFDARMTEKLFRMIRPTGNCLNGYEPSYTMRRIIEEAI